MSSARADGLPSWKQFNSQRTYFLYDGEQVLCELDGSGNLTRTYGYGANGLVQSKDNASITVTYTFDPQGTLVSRHNQRATYLANDICVYDAFGQRHADISTSSGNTYPSADAVGYLGQWGVYTDLSTGALLGSGVSLCRMGYRFYDPFNARFLTRDPIGQAGGVNLYSYCLNDPVNHGDPQGTDGPLVFHQATTHTVWQHVSSTAAHVASIPQVQEAATDTALATTAGVGIKFVPVYGWIAQGLIWAAHGYAAYENWRFQKVSTQAAKAPYFRKSIGYDLVHELASTFGATIEPTERWREAHYVCWHYVVELRRFLVNNLHNEPHSVIVVDNGRDVYDTVEKVRLGRSHYAILLHGWVYDSLYKKGVSLSVWLNRFGLKWGDLKIYKKEPPI